MAGYGGGYQLGLPGRGVAGAWPGQAHSAEGLPRREGIFPSVKERGSYSMPYDTRAYERSAQELAGYGDAFRPPDVPDYDAHTGAATLPSRGFGNWSNAISTTEVWGQRPHTLPGRDEVTKYITNALMSNGACAGVCACVVCGVSVRARRHADDALDLPAHEPPRGPRRVVPVGARTSHTRTHTHPPRASTSYKEFPKSLPTVVPNGGIDKAIGYKEGSTSITMTRIGMRTEVNQDEIFMGLQKDIWLKFKQVTESVKQVRVGCAVRACVTRTARSSRSAPCAPSSTRKRRGTRWRRSPARRSPQSRSARSSSARGTTAAASTSA